MASTGVDYSTTNATKVIPISLILARHDVEEGDFAGTLFDQSNAKAEANNQKLIRASIAKNKTTQALAARIKQRMQWEKDHPEEWNLQRQGEDGSDDDEEANEGETKQHVNSVAPVEFYNNTFIRPMTIPKDLFRNSVKAMNEGKKKNAYAHWNDASAETQTQRPPCNHSICKGWDLTLCNDCFQNIIAGEQLKVEETWKAKITAEDASDENHKIKIHQCGVQLDWLLAFTFDHDCWDRPTWWVNRHIVQEATQTRRCRYMYLDEMKTYASASKVFMSHCWGAKWGDLVLAACHGARKDRIVWIDVFAVRQWPGNGADLDFRVTLGRCHAMVVAVAPVETLIEHFLGTKEERTLFLSSDKGKIAKKNLFSFRLWCVVEVSAAVSLQVNIVVKGGRAMKVPSESTTSAAVAAAAAAAYYYDTDCIGFMMDNLSNMIDLESSECDNREDYDREMKIVQEMKGGVHGVNMQVVGVVVGAIKSIHCKISEIGAYVCGEPEALRQMKLRNGSDDENEKKLAKNVLLVACSGGRINIVKELLRRWRIDGSYVVEPANNLSQMMRFLSSNEKEENFFEKEKEKEWLRDVIGYSGAIWDATTGGHIEIVSLLLKSVRGMKVPHPIDQTTGASAFYQACALGYPDLVTLFIQNMIEENSTEENPEGLIAMVNQPATLHFTTPFFIACQNGHAAVVTVLLQLYPYIDMNQCTQPGQQTPFNIAALQGHKEVVGLLWENKDRCKIELHKKDFWGNSPLDNATQGKHEWIIQLLTDI